MKFRTPFSLCVVVALIFLAFRVVHDQFAAATYDAVDVQREDARHRSTVRLQQDAWSEFQIPFAANNVRLLTNAALHSSETAPPDIVDTRAGWRYSVDYELLDSGRNVVKSGTYHFRSSVRKLVDRETGQEINPMFFGNNDLNAAQTRTMQLAVEPSAGGGVFRVRKRSVDAPIEAISARVVARVERKNYGERATWNRMSPKQRESIAKYCVYSADLLTSKQLATLLHWRWNDCPPIGTVENMHLFFIGDAEDVPVAEKRRPEGQYADEGLHCSVPVPSGQAQLRLAICPLEEPSTGAYAEIRYQSEQATEVEGRLVSLSNASEDDYIDVEGGLVDIRTSVPVSIQAFWTPVGPVAFESAQRLFPNAANASPGGMPREYEITPKPIRVRTYLVDGWSSTTPTESKSGERSLSHADSRALDFRLSQVQNASVPLRLQIRVPMSDVFAQNSELVTEITDGAHAASGTESQVKVVYEFLRKDGSVTDQGEIAFVPTRSSYDWLTAVSEFVPLSEPVERYFSVPEDADRLRITSEKFQVLINAYVRPPGAPRVFDVSERMKPLERRSSVFRSWFGLHPEDREALMRKNRSFLISLQVDGDQTDESVTGGYLQWNRINPEGEWIARQLLIPEPQDVKENVQDDAKASTLASVDFSYSELIPNQKYAVAESTTNLNTGEADLIYAGNQRHSKIELLVDGVVVDSLDVASAHGEVSLATPDFAVGSQIAIRCAPELRLFARGLPIEASVPFRKRTAQRLDRGVLEFVYAKETSEAEVFTVRLFAEVKNAATGAADTESHLERLEVNVDIVPPQTAKSSLSQPQETWTALNRRYVLETSPNPRAMTSRAMTLGTGKMTDQGYRCFVKLGPELPPGRYRVRVELENPEQNAYALVYQSKRIDTPPVPYLIHTRKVGSER